MSDDTEEEEVEGVLIRGADGRMFFISEEDLEGFQMEREEAAMVQELIDDNQEVAGFNFEVQSLSPEVTMLPTLQGPIGRRAIDPSQRMQPADWALCNGNASFFKGI